MAAFVVAVPSGWRGARDAVGAGSWPRFALGSWVRTGPLLLPSCVVRFYGLCTMVLVILLLVVVVVVLLLAVLSFGDRFWFEVGLGLGSGSRLRRTSSGSCEGTAAWWAEFVVCCRAARVACVGVGGPPAAWQAAAALALAVALWMRSAGRRGSEEEVE